MAPCPPVGERRRVRLFIFHFFLQHYVVLPSIPDLRDTEGHLVEWNFRPYKSATQRKLNSSSVAGNQNKKACLDDRHFYYLDKQFCLGVKAQEKFHPPRFPHRGTGGLVSPLIPSFHIIHKRLIHYTVTARCGIVAGKVPVAQVAGAGSVQRLDSLVDNVYG